jgi:hypothetical protein
MRRVLGLVTATLVATGVTQGGQQGLGPIDIGTRDAALTRLFVPPSAPAGAYEVFRSPRAIAVIAAELRARDPDPLEDAWRPVRTGPADAFGSNGLYDPMRLARLYVGTVPLVARGSLRTPEGVVGYTLIAPWPDSTFTTLQPGTMVIVVHVTALTGMR